MKFVLALLIGFTASLLVGCNSQKLNFPECLKGLDEVHLKILTPYEGDKEYDSLNAWQKAHIAESLEKHGVQVYKLKADFELPKRFLEYESRITDVFPNTAYHQYLVRIRLSLRELVDIERPGQAIHMEATTWNRNYVAHFTDERDIIPFLRIATDNLMIEFENTLIDDNLSRLSEFKKQPQKPYDLKKNRN